MLIIILITVTTSVNGNLEVREVGPPFDSNPPFTDHVPFSIGMNGRYSWLVGHNETPSVLWLKDGVAVQSTLITNTPLDSNNLLTTLSFTSFQDSDAGVYQVIFAGTANSEVVITRPLLLHTGKLAIVPLTLFITL